jgi:hypothetical protein
MARLPLPERGQPLDLSYIYQMSTAINELASALGYETSGDNFTIDSPDSAQKQTIATSAGKVIGAYVEVATNSDITSSNTEIPGSYSFNFKFPPIVVATIRDRQGTEAGSNANVVIKNVTASNVSFVVKFRNKGKATVGVNLLIIGIPNS